jgi:lipopolysaccharide transport system ATP-binding protein
MSNLAIRVDRLGKRYIVGASPVRYRTLRESLSVMASSALRRFTERENKQESQKERNAIWALRDVSFEVEREQAVGIIGLNGAGKSTLLKILSRVTSPTCGRAEIYGRVVALLEVGTGFNSELTGRENIFLNASILGMPRAEIIRKFDEIVEFSEIGRFLDTPMKRYSSGMAVRLAFSIAAYLEPDILIADEVLAVGDIAFQTKCLGKMNDIARLQGRTVLFVSHNLPSVKRLTQQCIWLDRGQIREMGATEDVIRSYLARYTQAVGGGTANLSNVEARRIPGKAIFYEVIFEAIRLLGRDGLPISCAPEGDPLTVELVIRSFKRPEQLEILCRVRTAEGVLVFTALSGQRPVNTSESLFLTSFTLEPNPLRPGRYHIELVMLTRQTQDVVPDAIWFEVVGNPREGDDFRYAQADYHSGLIRVDSPWRDFEPARSLFQAHP